MKVLLVDRKMVLNINFVWVREEKQKQQSWNKSIGSEVEMTMRKSFQMVMNKILDFHELSDYHVERVADEGRGKKNQDNFI